MRYVVEYIDYRQGAKRTLPLRLRVVTPSNLPMLSASRPHPLAKRFPTETICHILHDAQVAGFSEAAQVNILRVNGQPVPPPMCYCRVDGEYHGMCIGFVVRPDVVNMFDFELREVDA